jgi:acyl dehydratase
MRIFNGFDEIKSAVGSEIGVSDWIEITQDRINRFAEATCDQQWIHVDQQRAKEELPGGLTIAHGLLSLSLASLFIRSVMGLKGLRNPQLWRRSGSIHYTRNVRLPAAGPRLHR